MVRAFHILNLVKSYSGKRVLDIPSIDVDVGSIIALTGNNGAGKTTLLRLALDLTRADQGAFYIKGKNVASNDIWKKYVASYLDEKYLIGYLTPEEYFYFIGKLRGLSIAQVDEKLRRYERFFHYEILGQKKYIREFSKGNKQKIGIVSCLMQSAEIVFLDEPFANLDPTSRSFLRDDLTDLNKRNGTTFLISSHDLGDMSEIASRVFLMENGVIIKDMKMSDMAMEELRTYFNMHKDKANSERFGN